MLFQGGASFQACSCVAGAGFGLWSGLQRELKSGSFVYFVLHLQFGRPRDLFAQKLLSPCCVSGASQYASFSSAENLNDVSQSVRLPPSLPFTHPSIHPSIHHNPSILPS